MQDRRLESPGLHCLELDHLLCLCFSFNPLELGQGHPLTFFALPPLQDELLQALEPRGLPTVARGLLKTQSLKQTPNAMISQHFRKPYLHFRSQLGPKASSSNMSCLFLLFFCGTPLPQSMA